VARQLASEMEPGLTWDVAFRDRDEDSGSRLGCEQPVTTEVQLPGIDVVADSEQLAVGVEEKGEVSAVRESRRSFRGVLEIQDHLASGGASRANLVDDTGKALGHRGRALSGRGHARSHGAFEAVVVRGSLGNIGHPTRRLVEFSKLVGKRAMTGAARQ